MTNVDPDEIHKFETQAQDWWDPDGNFKPLHQINPLRLKFITDSITIKDKKILDIGCGGGILAESLAEHGAQVTGIDLSPAAIKAAKTHADINSLEIDYQVIATEEFSKNNAEQFDVITCMELLEHVPHPELLIKHAVKCVKPGGQLFFSTLNRNPKSFLFAIVGAEYILNLVPRGTHEYAKFIKPSELQNWLQQHNCDYQAFKGVIYNPFTKHFALADDISVSYLVHAVKGHS